MTVAIPLWTGLAPTRETLPNGVVVIAKATSKTAAVAIEVTVPAGTICDPADRLGAMNLLARMMDRGTATRSASEIAETLDSRGVFLSVAATRHATVLHCTCLAVDLEPILSLIADVIAAAAFPALELETRRREVVTGLRQDEDNPGVRAGEELRTVLFGAAHPYGRRSKGTVGSVSEIGRDTLARLRDTYVTSSGLNLVMVGDVEVARMLDVARSVFGGWSPPQPADILVEPPGPATGRRRLAIPMMNKAQVDIAYGFVTMERSDPAYYALWLVNNALGQYGLGGRLGDNIRERQGMAYYVSSALDASMAAGSLVIRAGVNPSNVERTIDAIDDELVKLRREGLTADELEESRRFLIRSMPRALETNAGIAHFLQTAEFFGLGLDYDQRLPDLLGRVTLDAANAVARQAIDSERAAIVVAGPYES
jgi:zinc protease